MDHPVKAAFVFTALALVLPTSCARSDQHSLTGGVLPTLTSLPTLPTITPTLDASPLSAPESNLRVDLFETQAWPHQGNAEGWLIGFPPPGFTAEQVVLRNKRSGAVEHTLGVEKGDLDSCYGSGRRVGVNVFKTKESVVIAQGPLYESKVRMDIYRIDVILKDVRGTRIRAVGMIRSLCGVMTE
jgi:hypothetical protein